MTCDPDAVVCPRCGLTLMPPAEDTTQPTQPTSTMPTGDAFIDAYYAPALLSKAD